ncbi:RNA polymerase sigma factor [Spongiimicrobium sp. 3-5]|uniref:RNA polymerase sigma factor n=1 Tax=Spongiimicrobium sp. 3-5 TaxID=3332596 RepID=UPI0039818A43
MNSEDPKTVVEHLFRTEYGKVIAALTFRFGTAMLERIEDSVQDTLIKAMQVWAYKSVPDNPTAWLLKVASNHLIDQLRRDRKINFSEDVTPFFTGNESEMDTVRLDTTISDSQLKMVFACCHPSLSQEYQIILSLKLIGGFHNREIAEALLKKEETIAKAFTRAKKKLKDQVETLNIPVEMGLQSRLFVVMRVIYLLFSEGYAATSGSQMIKRDICYEAIRLALILYDNPHCRHPNLNALIALMCFHASRFDARLDENMELVDLEHQDRKKYIQELIQIGIYHLESSGTLDNQPSNYHLEAAVSYYHCMAKSFETTDWKNILRLYNLQLQRQYSPVVLLNRVVPYYKVHGAKKALLELENSNMDLTEVPNGLYYAIKAELVYSLQDWEAAKDALKQAIGLTKNELEKKHLQKKLHRVEKNQLQARSS